MADADFGKLQVLSIAGISNGSAVYIVATNPKSGAYFQLLARSAAAATATTAADAAATALTFHTLGLPASSLPGNKTLYTKDGSLWVELTEVPTGKNRPLAARLANTAIAQRIPDASPVLVDSDDQLWVKPLRLVPGTPEWAVATPGNLEPFTDFPLTFPRRLVAAGPSRVLATSELGVLELTSASAAPSKFSAGPLEKLPDQQPVFIDASSTGAIYLVTPRIEGGSYTIGTLDLRKK
jgi:hypothetical protein